jgi:hypothetical protein
MKQWSPMFANLRRCLPKNTNGDKRLCTNNDKRNMGSTRTVKKFRQRTNEAGARAKSEPDRVHHFASISMVVF